MINVIWDDGFKKKYKKVIKNNNSLHQEFWSKMQLFIENPHNPILKTHKLSGRLKYCWASTINYNYRIVFKKIDESNIRLIDIGSHSEVY